MANTMQTPRSESSTGQAVDTVKDHASTAAGTARDEASVVVRDAGTHAREVVGETKDQLRRQASEQTDRLSSSLRQMSDQIRGMSEGRGAPDGMVGDLTRQLADMTGGAASRLESGGLDGALDDVKRFARNRPGVFIAAAVGTGFLVGRLMKAVDTKSVMGAAKDSMSPDDGSQTASPPAFGDTTPPLGAGPTAGTAGTTGMAGTLGGRDVFGSSE